MYSCFFSLVDKYIKEKKQNKSALFFFSKSCFYEKNFCLEYKFLLFEKIGG